jgi:hypothetical protein
MNRLSGSGATLPDVPVTSLGGARKRVGWPGKGRPKTGRAGPL